jgi:hypothetical protein
MNAYQRRCGRLWLVRAAVEWMVVATLGLVTRVVVVRVAAV